MIKRVLILGSSGFIGGRIVTALHSTGLVPILASRSPSGRSLNGLEQRQVDTLDAASLAAALCDVDAVVNCVAGSGPAIAQGALLLANAAAQSPARPRIVHMSSMAVYGAQEGLLTESSPLDPTLGWYAKAKCEAEKHLTVHAKNGHSVVMLRPGCVHGPGSDMWVGRIGQLLESGRLGDLGEAGDGWSNLVHVDDVCAAVIASLRLKLDGGDRPMIFNLTANDSPRWNTYFTDLAVKIGATPVKRLSAHRVRVESRLFAPTIRITEIIAKRLGLPTTHLPVPMSPSLTKLWAQHVRMDVSAAAECLHLRTRSYDTSLEESARWYCDMKRVRACAFKG